MRAPFSFIKSSGFNPATLSLTGWWRANYANPWTPTASAGSSGTNGNLVNGVAPSAGTTQNGFTPAALNGTTQYLVTANAPGSYLALGGGTILVLAYVVSAPATSGTSYADPTLCGTQTSVEMEMSISSSGFVTHIFDGGHKDSVAIPFTTGAYHLFAAAWNGANLFTRVDGGTVGSIAAGAIDSFSGMPALIVGANYNASAFANARILEVMTLQSNIFSSGNTTTLDSIRASYNSRYGISI